MSQTKGLYRSYILMFVCAFGAFLGNIFFSFGKTSEFYIWKMS